MYISVHIAFTSSALWQTLLQLLIRTALQVLTCDCRRTITGRMRAAQVVIIRVLHDETCTCILHIVLMVFDPSWHILITHDGNLLRRYEACCLLMIIFVLIFSHHRWAKRLLPLQCRLLNQILLLFIVLALGHLRSRKCLLLLLLLFLLLFLLLMMPKHLIIHGHVRVNLVQEVWVKLKFQFVIDWLVSGELHLGNSRLKLFELLLLHCRLLLLLLGGCVDDVTGREFIIILLLVFNRV